MALPGQTIAQPGDEAARQLDPYAAIGERLMNEISLSEGLRAQRQQQTQRVQSFAGGTGVANTTALRDLGQRVSGERPSDLIGSANDNNTQLRSAVTGAIDREQAAGKNVLDALTTLMGFQKQKEESAREEKALTLKEKELGLKEKELGSTGLGTKDLLELQIKARKEGLKIQTGEDGSVLLAPLTEEELAASAIDDLPASAKSKAGDYLAFLAELKSIKSQLDELSPGQGLGLTEGTTGPIAQLFGQLGKAGQFRASIENLTAKVRNKQFGSALTESELKEANKFLPGAGKQELTNEKRILALIAQKENELRSHLQAFGLSPKQVESFMAQAGGSEAASSDPLGLLE